MTISYLKMFNITASAILAGFCGEGLVPIIAKLNYNHWGYAHYASYVVVILIFILFNADKIDFYKKEIVKEVNNEKKRTV